MGEANMSDTGSVWALILAAGDGSRLRALTTKPCGTAVPKQFCSLHGGHSLLEDAIDRAGGLVPPERICTIVAQQHRQWWSESDALSRLPHSNLIVQPRNRGTAIGILYSLLHILAKDPYAQVVLLPADHYVRDEEVLRQALYDALERVRRRQDRPVLLGLEPDETDTELGYILPGGRDPSGGLSVHRFVEKPKFALASKIIGEGGLWNTFIMAAAAQTLVNLFLPRHAAMVMEMQVILSQGLSAHSPAAGWPAIVDMYERLPELDFSRDLLEGQESQLCVQRVPACGWSDLGTPRRVGETLRRLQPQQLDEQPTMVHSSAYMNLAAQHARFERMQLEPRV
jgi:mannose-1-phosphate guanylyltransferase